MNPLIDPLTGQMLTNNYKPDNTPKKLDRSEVSFSEVYDKEADKAFDKNKSKEEKFKEDIEDFKKDITHKSLEELKELRKTITQDISKYMKKGKQDDLHLAQAKYEACRDEIRKRLSAFSYTPVNNFKLSKGGLNSTYHITYTSSSSNSMQNSSSNVNVNKVNVKSDIAENSPTKQNSPVSMNVNSSVVKNLNSSLPPEMQAQQLMASLNNTNKYNVMYNNFMNGSLNVNNINDLSALAGESDKKDNDILGF